MTVIKKINNNVAICRDGSQRELAAFGKGIGFPPTPYELTDLSKIDRTLADHIAFVIERAGRGIYVQMPSVYEMEMNYPAEAKAGRRMVAALRQKLKIKLPKGEILAMHLINARDKAQGEAAPAALAQFFQDSL